MPLPGRDPTILDMIKNEDDMLPPSKLPGYYPAIVKEVEKSKKLMRIRVLIPYIHHPDEKTSLLPWAEPNSLFAGKDRGIYFQPEVNDTVWVVFKQGDPDHPIWTGSWYGQSDAPAEVDSDKFVIKFGGHIIELSKKTGELRVLIKTKGGRKIEMSDSSSEISIDAGLGSVKILAAQGISFGQGANIPVNDLPTCLFTGTPHGIASSIPGPTNVKVP